MIGEPWVVIAWGNVAEFIADDSRVFVTWVTVDSIGGTGVVAGLAWAGVKTGFKVDWVGVAGFDVTSIEFARKVAWFVVTGV